jgi:hypothetical protein
MAFSLYRRPVLERRSILLFSSWLQKGKRSAPAARRRPKQTGKQAHDEADAGSFWGKIVATGPAGG